MRALRKRTALARLLEAFCPAVASAGGETYLVGGFVRDLIEGRHGRDIDLMVTGMGFDRLGAVLRALPARKLGILRVLPVGKAFAVYKVRTSWAEDEIDVALARAERSTGTGHREFEIRTEGVDAREDAARRDFTINSLMIAARVDRGRLTGRVVDRFGGLRDLRRGRIRGVGNPEERFREDPLRMLRAIRQKNERDGYTIERKTREAIARLAPRLLRAVSRERIVAELLRSLRAGAPATVEDLRRTGILPVLLPEVNALGKAAVARMKRRYAILETTLGRPLPETVLLANLLADVANAEGAPASGRAGGTRVGIPRTERIARRLHVPQVRRVVQMLSDMLRLGDPRLLRDRLARAEAIFARWEDPRCLLALYVAARKARGRKAADFGPLLRTAAATPRLVSGRTLIALGIPAGPRMESLLEEVREATLARRVTTRKEAEDLALALHAGGGRRPPHRSRRESRNASRRPRMQNASGR